VHANVRCFQHFRESEYSPTGRHATKLKDNLTVSEIDKLSQPDVENRLLPFFYVIEKGNPIISVALGPSTSYVIEGGCCIVEHYRKLNW